MRNLEIAVLALFAVVAVVLVTVVLSVGVGEQYPLGQDALEANEDLRARIEQGSALVGRLLASNTDQPEEDIVGGLIVRSPDGVIQFPSTRSSFSPVDTSIDGMMITADEVRLNIVAGGVEVIGNVAVTTARDDGSTVTMRTERMTIVEELSDVDSVR
jgi:hypothetical protein